MLKSKKNIITTGLVCGIMLSSQIASAESYKTISNLNLRSGDSIKDKIIKTMPKGTVVKSIDKFPNGWFKVNSNGTIGYVSSKYLETHVDNSQYSTTGNLNMRTGGSTSHKIITTIPSGKLVEVLDSKGEWFKVKYGGHQGFVHSGYLKKPSSPKPPENNNSRTYYTNVNLNIRAGESTHHKILGTIPKGKTIKVLQRNGLWSKIQYGNITGFVSSVYISESPISNKPEDVSKTYNTTDPLNMRSGNSTNASVIMVIPRGGRVDYISTHGDWFKVKYNGKTGYVNRRYLTEGVGGDPAEVVKIYETTTNLNMRSGRSTNHKIITTIPKGKRVNLISEKDGWYEVEYNKSKGFVSSMYVKDVTDKGVSNGVSSYNTQTKMVESIDARFELGYFKSATMPISRAGYKVTSSFGERVHPITGVVSSVHQGVDLVNTDIRNIKGKSTVEVKSALKGVITKKVSSKNGYGNYVEVYHGGVKTLYAHMDSFNDRLKVGSNVKQGEVLGYAGSTGNSTGNHLHFEVIKGHYKLDPGPFIALMR